jgi:hypothetical protein
MWPLIVLKSFNLVVLSLLILMIIQRCLHLKLPTDGSLSNRGCSPTSMCSRCEKEVETTKHLFLDCTFAQRIWRWLASILNVNCHFHDLVDVF